MAAMFAVNRIQQHFVAFRIDRVPRIYSRSFSPFLSHCSCSHRISLVLLSHCVRIFSHKFRQALPCGNRASGGKLLATVTQLAVASSWKCVHCIAIAQHQHVTWQRQSSENNTKIINKRQTESNYLHVYVRALITALESIEYKRAHRTHITAKALKTKRRKEYKFVLILCA